MRCGKPPIVSDGKGSATEPCSHCEQIRSILEFLPVVVRRVLETFGFEGESQLIS